MPREVFYVTAALLAVAALPLPYGYFVFLRLAVTAVAAWAAVTAWRRGSEGWVWGMGAIALLFNPVIPIQLEKGYWIFLDLAAAAAMLAASGALGRPKRS